MLLLKHYLKTLLAYSYIDEHLSWKLYVVAAVFYVYQKWPFSHYGHKRSEKSSLFLLQIISFAFCNLDSGHSCFYKCFSCNDRCGPCSGAFCRGGFQFPALNRRIPGILTLSGYHV